MCSDWRLPPEEIEALSSILGESSDLSVPVTKNGDTLSSDFELESTEKPGDAKPDSGRMSKYLPDSEVIFLEQILEPNGGSLHEDDEKTEDPKQLNQGVGKDPVTSSLDESPPPPDYSILERILNGEDPDKLFEKMIRS